MPLTIDLLPLSTIRGYANSDFYADVSDTIDTSRYGSATLSIMLLQATVCELVVEGSDDGQEYFSILSVSTQGVQTAYLDRHAQPGTLSNRLYRFLRWRIDPSAGSWLLSGRATLVLK